ncbi:hypothetical protein JCM6882_004010 [Rhodosporidiobolus microsporus]
MCRNVTSLVYGLPVRIYTLARAADAWPFLEPAYRFFDLVSLRLRKGEIRASGANGQLAVLERVPTEVWMLVRDELISHELEGAERKLIWEYCCWCTYRHDDLSDPVFPPGTTWAQVVQRSSPLQCSCDDGMSEFKLLWEGKRLERVTALLHHYDLALPTTLPLTSYSSWARSPGQFDLILAALARTFRLEPLAAVDDACAMSAEGVPVSETSNSRFVRQELAELEPNWMLLTTGVSVFEHEV